jgi:hypothetical protein
VRRFFGLVLVCVACAEKYPLDEELRFHHLQAIGTHNSYHLEPESPFDDSHRYSHAALDVQLELGARQFELDLHLTATGIFEVFHLPGGVDSETTCLKFTDCLQVMKNWSEEHDEHLPLMVWLEPKDEDFDWADARYQPIFGHYEALEAEVLSVWPAKKVISPDEIRGAHATLPEAIESTGWPALGALRGRIIFALLDSENHRAAYLQPAANLAGRLFFVATASTSEPSAALFKINDARSDAARIAELAAKHYLITTNADSVGESDASNLNRLQASLDAGAHFSSTDFIGGEGYRAEIPGGAPARCNPRTAPVRCTAADIEALDR